MLNEPSNTANISLPRLQSPWRFSTTQWPPKRPLSAANQRDKGSDCEDGNSQSPKLGDNGNNEGKENHKKSANRRGRKGAYLRISSPFFSPPSSINPVRVLNGKTKGGTVAEGRRNTSLMPNGFESHLFFN